MPEPYVPSGATNARLGWLVEQLEALREQDPPRYEAMAAGMHMALASIREACYQLDIVLAKVQSSDA